MNIERIQIYAEVLEQGYDFRDYLRNAGFEGEIKNCYSKKGRARKNSIYDSLVDRIREVKDVDVLITVVSNGEEFPMLMVEYSTAVPTDDHRMQRSDVYYWGAKLRTPVLKISPLDKGMNQDFGGGSRITNDQEIRIAYEQGALLFFVQWRMIEGLDVLPTKQDALSCIPYSEEIQLLLGKLLNTFSSEGNYDCFYSRMKEDYEKKYNEVLSKTPLSKAKESIVNSSRFQWIGDKLSLKLSLKINRFGHAMDPDRGVLYYANMLVGADNTIVEFQVNRTSKIDSRGGYRSLFDGLGKITENRLLTYVKRIIEIRNNIFTDEDALYVFMNGLGIQTLISPVKSQEHEYYIPDDQLSAFLSSQKGMVAKTVFFLSTEVRLTDQNRDVICKIKWNKTPGIQFINSIYTDNRVPLKTLPLTLNDATEDIITFASVELYKKIQCGLISVSYPGAQGDRCILSEINGRKTLRTYVDIIAYKKEANGTTIFLEECKDRFYKSYGDVEKLHKIIDGDEMKKRLSVLVEKCISETDIREKYISVAAKHEGTIPSLDVDYFFMFDICSDKSHTFVDYTVAIVKPELCECFRPLLNNGRLTGRMTFECINVIKD